VENVEGYAPARAVWEVSYGLQTSSYDLISRFVGLGKENLIDD